MSEAAKPKATAKKVSARTPGINEFLMAMRIVLPMVRREMEDPKFSASAGLQMARDTALRISRAALGEAAPSRYIVGRLTDVVIDSKISDAPRQGNLEAVMNKLFSGDDQAIERLVADLAAVVESRQVIEADPLTLSEAERLTVLRAALLTHCGDIVADVVVFSFWNNDPEYRKDITGQLIQLVGELALQMEKEVVALDPVPVTARVHHAMLQALVARAAGIVTQSYRSIGYAAMDKSRALAEDPARRQQVRDQEAAAFMQSIAAMAEARLHEVTELAMSFCKAPLDVSNTPKQ